MSLANRINESIIQKGSIGIYWLGQAGFALKTSDNDIIIVDAYFSDCCERIHGFKRIIPSLIDIEELKCNLIIATHAHYDHFDIDSVPVLIEKTGAELAGPHSVIKKGLDLGIHKDKLILLEEKREISFGDFKLIPVYADHGDLATDALGIIIDFNDFKLYFTGDTAYRPKNMKIAIQSKPEIIILPINDRFGNLNPKEAAKLANDTNANIAIPCHFWTFIEHNGDPLSFVNAINKYALDCKCEVLAQGEEFLYP